MPPPTPRPPADDDAIAGANIIPSPPLSSQSPSQPRWVSYDDNPSAASKVRTAKQHATPGKGCGSPSKKTGRRVVFDTSRTPCDVDLFAPSIVCLDGPSSASFNPPPPIVVTQSQSSIEHNGAPTITPATAQSKRAAKPHDMSDTTNEATVAKVVFVNKSTNKKSLRKKQQDKKKKKRSFGNKKVIMDNHIWEWMRESVFDPESVKFLDRSTKASKSGLVLIRRLQNKSSGVSNVLF